MKLRRLEDKEKFSIKDLFDILVETLRDYIPSGTDIGKILENWEHTVDEGDSQSEEYLELFIPVKLESGIDFLLTRNVGCIVNSDFEVPYAKIHIYGVRKDAYELLVTHSSIENLLDYFCGVDRMIDESYPFEEWIGDVNQAREFATKLKTYLDNYTKDLNTVFDCLKKIDSLAFTIWEIINKK